MISFRDIDFAVSDISDVSGVLPVLSWLLFAKKRKPYLLLGIGFCAFFAIRVFTLITAELHRNNMPAFHLLAFLEIAAVFSFYSQLLYQRVFVSGIIALFALHVFNTLFLQNVHTFNSLAWTMDMLLIIIMGMVYFYHLYNNENDHTPLYARPDFIITAGWLLYAAGSLFAYLMGTEILSGNAEGFFKNAWFFQSVSNIMKDLLISYGFWLSHKK